MFALTYVYLIKQNGNPLGRVPCDQKCIEMTARGQRFFFFLLFSTPVKSVFGNAYKLRRNYYTGYDEWGVYQQRTIRACGLHTSPPEDGCYTEDSGIVADYIQASGNCFILKHVYCIYFYLFIYVFMFLFIYLCRLFISFYSF